MSGILKKFGQAKQLIGEKYGSTGKTETSEDVKKLEHDSEIKFASLEKIHNAGLLYLNSLGKKKESGDDKSKVLPIEALGTCMMKHGVLLTDESPYGQALIKCGEVQERIATVQLDYVGRVRDTYMASLERSMTDMKEYQHLRKKLENRRLDFDAKLNRVQKSKKEKPELEEEMRTAQAKYEESVSDLQNRMFRLAESEESHLRELVAFVEAELHYFSQGAELLRNLSQVLTDRAVKAVARANLSRTGSMQKLSVFSETGSIRSFGEHVAEPESYDQPITRAQNVLERERSISRSSSGNLSEYLPPAAGSRPASRKASYASQGEGSSRKVVRATFDFKGEDENEMSLAKGDIITVVEEIDEGWWIGELIDSSGTSRRGMFPSNYTEPSAEATPHQPPRPLPRSNSRDPVTIAARPTNVGVLDVHATPVPRAQPGVPATESRSTTASPGPPTIPARMPSTSIRRAQPPAPVRRAVSRTQSHLGPGHAVQPVAVADVPPCRECGCDEFSANVFKKGSCNNCFHKHE